MILPRHIESPLILPALEVWARSVIDSRPPNQIIDRITPYMERWMIARKITVPTSLGRSSFANDESYDLTPMPTEVENLYLHRFMRDDKEDLHCHPWWNISLVLYGYYHETTPEGEFVRWPGDLIFRPSHARHAITHVKPGTISLFATGPKEREWGYWPRGEEFVHHQHYDAWRAANLESEA